MAKKYQPKLEMLSNNPEVRKTLLDLKGVPKSMKGRHLDRTNYYHKLWNWFGRTYGTRVQIN